jgi:hypothetical protein
MKKFLPPCLFSLILVIAAHAQDKIYRNNGKVVEARIIEVGSDEIKYHEYNDPGGVVYILETDRIKKIVFENGKVRSFDGDVKDPERYAGQRSRAIKFNFLSPLYGYTEIGFEQSTGVGKGYELSLGVIGAGKSRFLDFYDSQLGEVKRNPFGIFISGGYKFGKLPDFILFGRTRFSHLMQGTYIKPIVYLGNYKENRLVYKSNNVTEIEKQNVTFAALQIEVGKQWVLGDRFVLDFYEGLGYGFDNKKESYQNYYYSGNDNFSAFNYANSRLGRSPGLSYTFGIKLGFLLKNKQPH